MNNFHKYQIEYAETYFDSFEDELSEVTGMNSSTSPELFKNIKDIVVSLYNTNCYKENHIIIPINKDYATEIIELGKLTANMFISSLSNFWSMIEEITKPKSSNIHTKKIDGTNKKTGNNVTTIDNSGTLDTMSEIAPINAINTSINTPSNKFNSVTSGHSTNGDVIDETDIKDSTETLTMSNVINTEIALKILREYGVGNVLSDISKKITLETISIL